MHLTACGFCLRAACTCAINMYARFEHDALLYVTIRISASAERHDYRNRSRFDGRLTPLRPIRDPDLRLRSETTGGRERFASFSDGYCAPPTARSLARCTGPGREAAVRAHGQRHDESPGIKTPMSSQRDSVERLASENIEISSDTSDVHVYGDEQ